MTDKEMARAVVAERLIEGEITIKGAAEVLRVVYQTGKKDQKESENRWSFSNSSWQ